MALVSQAQDAFAPPSPSLTNPDMILPYDPSYKDPIRAPSHPQQPTEPFSTFGPMSRRPSQPSTPWSRQTFQQASGHNARPSMPGEWQTEEDINALQVPAARGPGGTKRKSGAKFMSTILDPRLRAGMALENCEYSPSIYSPTESELAAKSPYIKSPYPKGPYQSSEGPNLKSPYQAMEGPYQDEKASVEDVDPQDEVRAILDEDENDPYSHTALSIRAEEILANAKQRLTAMENNLSRARSISVTRSISVASGEEGPSHSPTGKSNNWAISAAKLRQSNFSPTSNTGHTRVFSETSVPGPMPSLGGGKRFDRDPLRTSSALGSSVLDNLPAHHPRLLEPLREDELMPSPAEECHEHYTSGSQASSGRSSQQPQLGTRHSIVQLRDLREQMRDLRGKVTSLKQRTREDNLRRRSLQMLKSPSPFTVAEGWSSPGPPIKNEEGLSEGLKDDSPDRSEEYLGNHLQKIASVNEEDPPQKASDESKHSDKHDDSATVDTYFESDARSEKPAHIELGKDMLPTAISNDQFSPHSEHAEFANIDDESEKSQALNPGIVGSKERRSSGATDDAEEPIETDFLEPDLPPPVLPERHEDRPDAFDYETYVVNSAMGSFSRQGFHSRSSSASTTNSASTTRPLRDSYDPYSYNAMPPPTNSFHPANATFNPPRPYHSRANSTDSTSTVGTFATATSDRQNGTSSRAQSRAHSRAMQNGYPSPYPTNTNNNTTNHPPSFRHNSFSPPLSPQNNNNNTGSNSSAKARSHIVATLLASAVGGDANAMGELGTLLTSEDEALVRGVIEGLQRACGGLFGEEEGREGVRRRLERARRVLDEAGEV